MTDYNNHGQYRPNKRNINSIVENLYHAISGNKPDEKVKERLYAGVEGMLQLYKENPNAFYATAAVAVLEANVQLGMKSGLADIVMKYIAQSFAEKAGYDLSDKSKPGVKKTNQGGK